MDTDLRMLEVQERYAGGLSGRLPEATPRSVGDGEIGRASCRERV